MNINQVDHQKKMKKTITKKDDFVYLNKGQNLVFQSKETDKLQCPVCGKSFQRLMNHITSKSCNINKMDIDINELITQLKAFKEGFRLEKSRKWKQKWRGKVIEEKGEEMYRTEQNNLRRKNRANTKYVHG